MTRIGILLMVEKGITERIHQISHNYPKANCKYMEDYGKIKELLYLMYWDKRKIFFHKHDWLET